MHLRIPFHWSLFALLGVFPAVARAHPMGAVSVNRFAVVDASPEAIRVQYSIDFAEVPAQSELSRWKSLGDRYAKACLTELLSGITLSVDGAPIPLTVGYAQAREEEGEGGLPILLVTGTLSASWPLPLDKARTLRFTDQNFRGVAGWREIRARGHKVTLSSPSRQRLLLAPEEKFLPFVYEGEAPADDEGAFLVTPGGEAGAFAPMQPPSAGPSRAPDALVALLGDGASGLGVLLLALLGSMLLGAGHALSPGHGKTVVAAYLVGERGTVGQALLLGATVTATHVSSVLLLGAVALWLSEYVLPETLYPILGLFSGVGVVAVGLALLRSRLRAYRRGPGGHTHHHDHHDHSHPHEPGVHAHPHRHDHNHPHEGGGHSHAHAHDHSHPHVHDADHGHEHEHLHAHHDHDEGHHHGPGGHTHMHRDAAGKPVGLWRLLTLGVSGGIVPCPSALVVLLAAISMHRIAFGMALIVAFSLGLAAVLMAIGVLVLKAKRLLARFERLGGSARWLPVASALLIVGLGTAIAVGAAVEGRLL